MKKIQIWESKPILKLAGSAQCRRCNGTRPLYFHEHPFYELGIVLSGECDWKLAGNRTLTLRCGEAVLLRPNFRHGEAVQPGKQAVLGWLGFASEGYSPAWCQRIITLGDDFEEIRNAFNAIYREHHREEAQSQLRVRLALQSVLLLVARQAEKPGAAKSLPASGVAPRLNARQVRCVESAAHYLRQNIRAPLSIAQVAAYQSLCPAYFSTLFHRYYGMAPRSFLQQARLQKAAGLLEGSDLTIKEIASQCGFVDSAHLCKAFKAAMGTTPKRFRGTAVA